MVNSRKAIFVLGMHRSGTSAVTAALKALGVELGHEDGFVSKDNLKGYFEDVDVVTLNDRILRHLGYSWNNPFMRGVEDRMDELDCFLDEAVAILDDGYKDHVLWGLKDPRMCLLLPFWNRVVTKSLGCEILYLHVLRNPLEVAASLRKRAQNEAVSRSLCVSTEHSLL